MRTKASTLSTALLTGEVVLCVCLCLSLCQLFTIWEASFFKVVFSRDFDYDSLDLKMMNNRRDIYRCISIFSRNSCECFSSVWLYLICDHFTAKGTQQCWRRVQRETKSAGKATTTPRTSTEERWPLRQWSFFVWMTGFFSGDRGQLWGDQPQAGRRLEKRRYIWGLVSITIEF